MRTVHQFLQPDRIVGFRRFAGIVAALLVIGLTGCATRASRCRELVKQIHNEHIVWDGSPMGLRVYAVGEPELKLLHIGPPCRPFVIEALNDDSRYVAAHVILTQMESSYS